MSGPGLGGSDSGVGGSSQESEPPALARANTDPVVTRSTRSAAAAAAASAGPGVASTAGQCLVLLPLLPLPTLLLPRLLLPLLCYWLLVLLVTRYSSVGRGDELILMSDGKHRVGIMTCEDENGLMCV